MKTPADKTAKRLSAEDWFARYGVSLTRTAPSQTQRPPADRIAVRA